jgi:hypothetical protein
MSTQRGVAADSLPVFFESCEPTRTHTHSPPQADDSARSAHKERRAGATRSRRLSSTPAPLVARRLACRPVGRPAPSQHTGARAGTNTCVLAPAAVVGRGMIRAVSNAASACARRRHHGGPTCSSPFAAACHTANAGDASLRSACLPVVCVCVLAGAWPPAHRSSPTEIRAH